MVKNKGFRVSAPQGCPLQARNVLRREHLRLREMIKHYGPESCQIVMLRLSAPGSLAPPLHTSSSLAARLSLCSIAVERVSALRRRPLACSCHISRDSGARCCRSR